jgi:alpha-galactosidase
MRAVLLAPLAFACAASAQVPVAESALPADAVWLESLDLSKMQVGYGAPQAALSVDKNPLMLGGTMYTHGVGAHAESGFVIDLKGGAKSFRATVGVDDEKKGRGSVVFQVFVDKKKVADSGVLRGGDAPRQISVDLTGAKRMTLRVQDAGDGIDSDHADWGSAMLTMLPGAAPPEAVAGLGANEPAPLIAPSSSRNPAPAIHGARVTGATPGRPFLFKIPATGSAPLKYLAKGLPRGLVLDASTGIITGALPSAGVSVVDLTVSNARGKASRKLTIVGGRDKLAMTPPMGWNSWNIYYCGVDEKKVREAADWMQKTGLIDHGYQYVNIDDCWQGERDASGELGVNPKFGDMKVLGDNLHARGFKFGIYSGPGTKTCAGYAGSLDHEAQDVATYSKWGVDYLKYDWCSYGGDVADKQQLPELEKQQIPYIKMGDVLANAPRDIVYSLCQYGMGDVSKWGARVHGDLWRTTGDIAPSYSSMASIGFGQDKNSPYAAPGGWNDPDMLFMHALHPNEQITHLSLWSLLAAPLLIGSDLSKSSQFTIDALSNDEVIEVDQDPLGIASRRVKVGAAAEASEVWARPLWDGTMAVGLFNRDFERQNVSVKWSELGLKGAQPVRDLWLQKNITPGKDGLTLSVPPHGALLFKIGKPKKIEVAMPRVVPVTMLTMATAGK